MKPKQLDALNGIARMQEEKEALEQKIGSMVDAFRAKYNIGAVVVVSLGHELHNPDRGDVNIITISDLSNLLV